MAKSKTTFTKQEHYEYLVKKEAQRLEKRRELRAKFQVLWKLRIPRPDPNDAVDYSFKQGYIFLQDSIVVYRWARQKLGLKAMREVFLLLYLYPLGAINRYEFRSASMAIDMKDKTLLQYFLDIGVMKVWREGALEETYYELSTPAKTTIQDMHLMLLGKKKLKKMPERTKVDKYYNRLMKEINERRDSEESL